MRATLHALLLVALAAGAAGAQTQQPRPRLLVEEVVIEGNRRLTDEEFLKHIRTRHGEPYDERQTLADLQRLLDLGTLDTTQTRVSIEDGRRGGKVVIFMVVELPFVERLEVRGLSRGLSAEEVLRAARAKGRGLEAGRVYSPEGARRALDGVRALLAARGLTGISVEFSFVVAGPGRVSVVVELREGRPF
jgi:outer membrane protein assembly factor BamA